MTISDKNKSRSGTFYRERADSLSRTGARTALNALRQRVRQARKTGDDQSVGWALIDTARVLRGQRRHTEAIKVLEDARLAFTGDADNRGLASVYHELSVAHRELHRNALALEYAHQAVTLFQSMVRTPELAWAYDNLAVIYFNRSQHHESLTYAERARAVFQESGSSDGQAWNACNLANIRFEMGQFAEAIRLYEEASALFGRLRSDQGRAWASFRQSFVHRALCEFPRAEALLEKARGLFATVGQKDRVAWCLLNTAAIKRMTGRQTEALALNKRVIRLHGPLRIHDGVGWALFQIGQILRDRGQHARAWQTLRRALTLHTDIANRLGMGWAENEIGLTYLDMGDGVHARESFAKARTHADALGCEPLITEVCRNQSLLALDGAELRQAAELLSRARGGAEKSNSPQADAENKLAQARHWALLGDLEGTAKAVTEARSLIASKGLTRLEPALDVFDGEALLARGDAASAAKIWKRAAVEAGRIGQQRERAAALVGLAQTRNTPAAMKALGREIGLSGSRALKAKFLLLTFLAGGRAAGIFNLKLATQSLNVARAAGLKALEKIILEVVVAAEKEYGFDSGEFRRDLNAILATRGADLQLIRFDPCRLENFPVSVVC